MKARSIEQRLAALRTLDPTLPASIVVILEALRSSIGILIASAAKLVAEHHLEALVPELPDAFSRLLVDPVKRDPGCRGKIAIARALDALEYWDDRVFVVGVRVIQYEGMIDLQGKREDSAAELRGVCGLAYHRFARADALDVLATLLTDEERTPRIAAAQGLGDAGRADASALLRYKLLVGDEDPEVLAAAIESLLSLAPEASLEFVIAFLVEHDDRAEAAALGLGGARVATAFEPLVAWCVGCKPEQRHRVGYLALALLRHDAATTHLLEAVTTHGKADAIAAAAALATFKHDPTLAARIREAAKQHRDPAVHRAIDALLY